MNTYTVTFFGHRMIRSPFEIEKRLDALIRKVLQEKDYVEFLVGRDGDFDQLVSSAIRLCKKEMRDDNSALVLILPYETAELRNNEASFRRYYDEIEVCNTSARGYFKEAHKKRNRYMIDRCDLAVFYVEREAGGAYQAMRYAKELGKRCVNLAVD